MISTSYLVMEKPLSEPNIAISFTKGVQLVSQKITKHHLIPLLKILN